MATCRVCMETMHTQRILWYIGELSPLELYDFGGRKYHKSWTAVPNRMDLLVMENWYIGELSPLELYDFGGGNVVAPVPDIGTEGGSYLTSHMFALTNVRGE